MTLRTGIIGTGFGARVHAPILQLHPDYEVVALSGVTRGKAQEVAASLGIKNAYSDWKTMLTDCNLEVVVIASNPTLHMEMVLASLDAGCHVICEKPPALNLSQALAMKSAAQIRGKAAVMNFEFRFNPDRQAIYKTIKSGVLGDILHVDWAEASAMWPQIANRPDSWLWKTEAAGGFFGAIGSHMLDSLHFWFGPLQSVMGNTVCHVAAREGNQGLVMNDADDSFYVHGKLASGGTCNVQFTAAAVGVESRLQIFGTKGTLTLCGKELKLAKHGGSFESIALEPLMDTSALDLALQHYVHPQWMLYSRFADSIRSLQQNRPEPVKHLDASEMLDEMLASMVDAAYVQAVMDAVRRSQHTSLVPIESW